MMNRFRLALIVLLAAPFMSFAAPRLPSIFSNNMVLQRDLPLPVWGWADPGEAITVSFSGDSATATADAEGNWRVSLKPKAATTEGADLVVTGADGKAVTCTNVVVGEVWICSGQSNMEFGVGAVTNLQEVRDGANLPLIRHIKFPHVATDAPQKDIRTSGWQVCTSDSVSGFTAVGYFFGLKLHQELGVPIGLIGTNWGGTRIEPWCTAASFAADPELADVYTQLQKGNPASPEGKAAYEKGLAEIEKWLSAAKQAVANGEYPDEMPLLPSSQNKHSQPTKLYNAMINPIVPYGIRGAIWYQGESNGNEYMSYYHKMKALIGGWRQVWGQGDFPFYYVQLANYQAPTNDPAGGNGWARLRESQTLSLDIPHTGMAVIIDIGDALNIHPKNKLDVGNRLARWALAKDYGKSDLVYSGPLYKSLKVEGNKIRLTFDHVGSGLMVGVKDGMTPTAEVPNGELKQFAIAGADKQWRWAEAVIDGDTVVVSSGAVPEPVAVRYAYRINPEGCNLYNREGLPASPFRTDDW